MGSSVGLLVGSVVGDCVTGLKVGIDVGLRVGKLVGIGVSHQIMPAFALPQSSPSSKQSHQVPSSQQLFASSHKNANCPPDQMSYTQVEVQSIYA